MKKNNCKRGSSKTISYKEMLAIMQYEKALIIDVRSRQEFQENHIAGAINIPLIDIKKLINMHAHDYNQVIIVYCNAGIRSVKAQTLLNMQGYKNVYVLESMY